MKKLVIALFAISLGLFSIPSYAIWEGVNELPSWDDYVKEHPNRGREQIEKCYKIVPNLIGNVLLDLSLKFLT